MNAIARASFVLRAARLLLETFADGTESERKEAERCVAQARHALQLALVESRLVQADTRPTKAANDCGGRR